MYSRWGQRYGVDRSTLHLSLRVNLHNQTINFVAENLVLRARSEKIGCAVNQHSGMMEYWSVGMMGLAEWDLIL